MVEGHYNLVLDCIKAIHAIAKEALKKIEKGYGYAEPRVMLNACYLGILALKKNQQGILEVVKESIVDFNQLYSEKYFSNLPDDIDENQMSPQRNQLFLECARWRDEVTDINNRDFLMHDDVSGMMLECGVDRSDIERFMTEISGLTS